MSLGDVRRSTTRGPSSEPRPRPRRNRKRVRGFVTRTAGTRRVRPLRQAKEEQQLNKSAKETRALAAFTAGGTRYDARMVQVPRVRRLCAASGSEPTVIGW